MWFSDLKGMKKEIDHLDELNLCLSCISRYNLKLSYNVYIIHFYRFEKWSHQPSRENVEILLLFTMNPVRSLKEMYREEYV